MNEYCKGCLKHSWGTSPERKKLEQEYNRNYYSANKNRWVINRQRRLGALTSNTDRNKSGKDVVFPGGFYNPGEFNDYTWRGVKKVIDAVKKIVIPKDPEQPAPSTPVPAPAPKPDVTPKPDTPSDSKHKPSIAKNVYKTIINAGKDFVKFLKESDEAYRRATSKGS